MLHIKNRLSYSFSNEADGWRQDVKRGPNQAYFNTRKTTVKDDMDLNDIHDKITSDPRNVVLLFPKGVNQFREVERQHVNGNSAGVKDPFQIKAIYYDLPAPKDMIPESRKALPLGGINVHKTFTKNARMEPTFKEVECPTKQSISANTGTGMYKKFVIEDTSNSKNIIKQAINTSIKSSFMGLNKYSYDTNTYNDCETREINLRNGHKMEYFPTRNHVLNCPDFGKDVKETRNTKLRADNVFIH